MSLSRCAAGFVVHTPLGPRKSGMPDAVDTPAPVSAVIHRDAANSSLARCHSVIASAPRPATAPQCHGAHSEREEGSATTHAGEEDHQRFRLRVNPHLVDGCPAGNFCMISRLATTRDSFPYPPLSDITGQAYCYAWTGSTRTLGRRARDSSRSRTWVVPRHGSFPNLRLSRDGVERDCTCEQGQLWRPRPAERR